MSSGHFKVNNSGMKQITRTMGRDATMAAAEKGARWARQNAPVRTGEYRDSFRVVPAMVKVSGELRQGAKLVNTSDHAWHVEWGYGAKHVLQRAIDVIERS